MVKVISLFSGCGGMDLGFEEAGFGIAYANDIDKDAYATFSANFPIKMDNKKCTTNIIKILHRHQ